MSQAYKKTTIKSFSLIRFLFMFLFLFSCASHKVIRQERRLTEREVIYQKGLALFNISKYAEAAPFFLKVSQASVDQQDEIYNSSLWNLTLIYEKFGDFDKSVLALQELERRRPTTISIFKIQLSLIKNYIRLGNKKVALEIRKKIDSSSPLDHYSLNEIYFSIAENTSFNFDLQMVEELQFLGEIEKYFIFAMESKQSAVNVRATELLTALYDGFFKALEKDSFNYDFKKALAVELLEQLRRFEIYKLDDTNLNENTISKFSAYSVEKQKILTDWLHQ